MQLILTQAIELFVIASIVCLVSDFVCGVRQTPQPIVIVEPISYATLDWVVKVDETQVESVDIVAIARAQMPKPNIASLGIRQLKKLASDRKLKGYSNMRKAELIAALS